MSDYIDREAAVKAAEEYGTGDYTVRGRHSGIADCIASEIANLPAADVAPIVHSEWVEDDYGFYHCRKCGYEWDESEYKTRFCPDCGANMEVEK